LLLCARNARWPPCSGARARACSPQLLVRVRCPWQMRCACTTALSPASTALLLCPHLRPAQRPASHPAQWQPELSTSPPGVGAGTSDRTARRVASPETACRAVRRPQSAHRAARMPVPRCSSACPHTYPCHRIRRTASGCWLKRRRPAAPLVRPCRRAQVRAKTRAPRGTPSCRGGCPPGQHPGYTIVYGRQIRGTPSCRGGCPPGQHPGKVGAMKRLISESRLPTLSGCQSLAPKKTKSVITCSLVRGLSPCQRS